MKTIWGKLSWAAAWAWLCITFWTGVPVLLMREFIPKPETPSICVVAVLLGLNALSFYCFSGMAADPRGGWRMWWQRERRYCNSDLQNAVLVFFLAIFWAVMGIGIARLAWKERDSLTDRLNRDDQWRQIHPRRHA